MIPSIPNVPTDSLYKFNALAGLIAALFILVFGLYSLNQTTQDIYNVSIDIEKMGTNIDYKNKIGSEYLNKRIIMTLYLYEKIQDSIRFQIEIPLFANHIKLASTINDTVIIIKNGKKTRTNTEAYVFSDSLYKSFVFYYKLHNKLSEKEKEIIQEIELLNDKYQEIYKSTAEDIKITKLKNDKLVSLHKDDVRLYWTFVVIFICSIAFSYVGFYKWENRCQIYNDNILKLQFYNLLQKMIKKGLDVDEILKSKKIKDVNENKEEKENNKEDTDK